MFLYSKNYSTLRQFETFDERLQYLSLKGIPGEETFGPHRYLNQKFYQSTEWRSFRNRVIVRDNGCDLGVQGHEIIGEPIYIHHINPIVADDVIEYTEKLMDLENSICTTFKTHQMIHYGDVDNYRTEPIERTLYDTCPWKKNGG